MYAVREVSDYQAVLKVWPRWRHEGIRIPIIILLENETWKDAGNRSSGRIIWPAGTLTDASTNTVGGIKLAMAKHVPTKDNTIAIDFKLLLDIISLLSETRTWIRFCRRQLWILIMWFCLVVSCWEIVTRVVWVCQWVAVSVWWMSVLAKILIRRLKRSFIYVGNARLRLLNLISLRFQDFFIQLNQ